jgi:hypothetical protein
MHRQGSSADVDQLVQLMIETSADNNNNNNSTSRGDIGTALKY